MHVLSVLICILCGFLGRLDCMKMKCPRLIGRDGWVGEKIGSVLRHSPEAGRGLLRGGQRASGGTGRPRIEIIVVVVATKHMHICFAYVVPR